MCRGRVLFAIEKEIRSEKYKNLGILKVITYNYAENIKKDLILTVLMEPGILDLLTD